MNLGKFFARDEPKPEQAEVVSSRNGEKDSLTPEQMRAAFAVPSDQLQWRATNQAIEMEIQTALRAALDLTMNPPACANEVCAIEHLDRLRRQIGVLRKEGLKVPE